MKQTVQIVKGFSVISDSDKYASPQGFSLLVEATIKDINPVSTIFQITVNIMLPSIPSSPQRSPYLSFSQ
jgi:hypothetical protein